MTFYPSGKAVASLVLAMAVLGGCEVSAIQRPMIAKVAPGDERIVFAAAEFAGTTPVHVKFIDSWQREDYALFKGNGAQGEILYAAANPYDQVALEYQFTVDRSVETWNLNRKYAKSWGDAERFPGPFAEFFYIPFTLVETDRSCFGFTADWDDPADDPDHRPGKVLFGYYCAKEGVSLTVERMEGLLEGIGIRGITERLRPRRGGPRGSEAPPNPPIHNRAARLAQGPSPGGETGNPGFPFDLARYYQVDGNGDRKGKN